MKRMLIIVAMLVFAQGYAIASDVTIFKDGATEGIANIESPAFSDDIEMTLPVESHIMKATVDVLSVPPNETILTSPQNVSLYLNDTLLWRYDGPDYGYFGLQDSFVNEAGTMSNQFGPSGGNYSTKIRLPKRVDVQNASFDVDCDGSYRGLIQELNLTGTGDFGNQVSGAGDLNNDGYADIIISAFSFNSSRGAAFIYFGGPAMDSVADLVLDGQASNDCFGYSVSGGGDLNGDGFDDVVVGAPYNYQNGDMTGSAYVFYGGTNMDSTPDVTLSGAWDGDDFGASVAIAGDLNKDNYDDVIVGADMNDDMDYDAGAAYIYFGGASMDSTVDATILGEYAEDYFGYQVASAGDVNKDGYDDVMVGASGYDDFDIDMGKVYLFYGGASMDTTPDLTVLGADTYDQLGTAISGAGDVNNDGYGDIIIGSQYNMTGGYHAGAAYVYYGGASMDATADVTMYGTAPYDYFGIAVSEAGDLNNDGYGDVMVGAFANDSFATDGGIVCFYYGGASMNNVTDIMLTGFKAQNYFGWSIAATGDLNGDGFTGVLVGTQSNSAFLYESAFGIKEPQVSVGSTLAWNMPWYFNSSGSSNDFADMLNSYISVNYASGADAFGNTYIDVPIKMSCKSDGLMVITGLKITYVCTQPVLEFTETLGAYMAAHRGEKDAAGNITITFKVTSATPGSVMLSNLHILTDDAPKLLSPIPDFEMDEDSMQSDQINLHEYFSDDFDSIDNIQFTLVSRTNESIVFVELLLNGFLSIDALTGPTNDNWTGVVEMLVNASDRWGSTTYANPFKVIVKNVPDPPQMTSQPEQLAVPGQPYVYNVTAVDGDNDALTFSLPLGPQNMTIDPELGNISWMPVSGGKYDVSISVTDGNFTVFQNYTINIPNRIPYISNTTIPEAAVDVPLEYLIPAVDPDGDALHFSFVTPVLGMTLDPPTGLISWTPTQVGTFPVSVAISDSKDTITYDFNITVIQPNRVPRFTSNPLAVATQDALYLYNATATDDDKNPLTFTLVSGPTGMVIDSSTGVVTWTPSDATDVSVSLKVSDGLGGEVKQDFTIKVSEAVPPKITVQDPAFTDKWSGKVTISGVVRKGTRDVSYVEIKVDSGDWKKAAGNLSWSYVLDTKNIKNGKHTLGTRAYDGKVYSDLTSDTFTVNNVAAAQTDYTMWIIIVVVVLVLAVVAGAALGMSKRKRPPAETEAAVEEEAPPEEGEEVEAGAEEAEGEQEAENEDAQEKEDEGEAGEEGEEEAEEETEEKPAKKEVKK